MSFFTCIRSSMGSHRRAWIYTFLTLLPLLLSTVLLPAAVVYAEPSGSSVASDSSRRRAAAPQSLTAVGDILNFSAHDGTDRELRSLTFEPNVGQTDPQVRFVTRSLGGTLFFTASEVVLSLPARRGLQEEVRDSRNSPNSSQARAGTILRFQFVNANSSSLLKPLSLLPGRVNYLHSQDQRLWHTNIPLYTMLRYEQLYDGIDLLYDGNRQELKGTYHIAPGADPDQIAWRYVGTQQVMLDPASGELLLTLPVTSQQTPAIILREAAPVAWQEGEGGRQPVDVSYVLHGDGTVQFQLGDFDPARSLIIDPVLAYSTYVGGMFDEQGGPVAVDQTGAVYIAGTTMSVDFPTTANAFDTSHNATQPPWEDVFITKLDPTGTTIIYSTYLGGQGEDNGASVAVDATGATYVTGSTTSGDFPTTPGAYDTSYNGGAEYYPHDVFVTKLSADGSTLLYSTYLGGSTSSERGYDIAVDGNGAAYVTGVTSSSDFPTTPGAVHTCCMLYSEAFITKLNPTGEALIYSATLGGNHVDTANSIAIDALGAAYVTGITSSSDFPTTPGAFDPTYNGGYGDENAFVAKLNPTGAAVIYATYISQWSWGQAIAVDNNGAAYVSGTTWSTDFPTTPGAYDRFPSKNGDAFVLKLNSAGSGLMYATYLGGGRFDMGEGIAVDAIGAAYVSGFTESTNFPVTNTALDRTFGGSEDVFVAKLDGQGQTLEYSTYLGGLGQDRGQIALDSWGRLYVAGFTDSQDFPVTYTAFGKSNHGQRDLFVTRFDFQLPTGTTILLSTRRNGSVSGVNYRDEDILMYTADTGTWSLFFDGSDVGLGNTDVDAFAVLPNGHLLLSTDTDFKLVGFGAVDDTDILEFTPLTLGGKTAGSFTRYFDGSDVGLGSSGEDIDAIDFDAEGNLHISVVGALRAPSQSGVLLANDEDLLRFHASSFGENTSGAFSIFFDGADVGLGRVSEDVSATWTASNEDIYLTTRDNFVVANGLRGDGNDVFICHPVTLGENTQCHFSFFWDGGAAGLGDNRIDGLHISSGAGFVITAASSDESVSAFDDTIEFAGDDIDDADEVDGNEVISPEETNEEETANFQLYLPVISR